MQVMQAAWLPLAGRLEEERPPEKRKVDSSILSLTTPPELAVLALLPAETQEERVFRQCVR
jgi:hypothetical protein